MALDFPSNPTNGQVFNQYVYNSTIGAWKNYNDNTAVTSALLGKANLSGGNTFNGNQTFNGYISKPNTPMFSGYRGDNTGSISDPILMNYVDVNVGNNYNSSTGRFTAPIAGYYFATVHAIGSNGNGELQIRKNNSIVTLGHWNHTTTWEEVSVSALIYCAASDYISFTSNGTGIYPNSPYNRMNIFLIG